jgi:nucleotide-binding universal stress UspA family protein
MLPINKILCPTDFSEASYQSLKNANELAGCLSAEIILLYVVSPLPRIPGSTSPTGFHVPAVLEEIENSAKNQISKLKHNYISSNIKSEGIVVIGDPPDEIVKYASHNKVDLIVMSTHGLSGWKRLVSGSVTEKVVRMADCPVLTIRGKEEK